MIWTVTRETTIPTTLHTNKDVKANSPSSMASARPRVLVDSWNRDKAEFNAITG